MVPEKTEQGSQGKTCKPGQRPPPTPCFAGEPTGSELLLRRVEVSRNRIRREFQGGRDFVRELAPG